MKNICGCSGRRTERKQTEKGEMTSEQRGETAMNGRTIRIVTTGIFAAMITVMTAYICHIPYGVNGGYIHFGDTLIYLAAVFLPRPYAFAAAAIGGGMADLLTAPMWMPATVIIKLLIVLPFTEKNSRLLSPRNIAAPIIAGAVSAAGYYVAEGILFGSFAAPVASLAGSLIQSGGSAVLFYAAAMILERSHVNMQIRRLMGFEKA